MVRCFLEVIVLSLIGLKDLKLMGDPANHVRG